MQRHPAAGAQTPRHAPRADQGTRCHGVQDERQSAGQEEQGEREAKQGRGRGEREGEVGGGRARSKGKKVTRREGGAIPPKMGDRVCLPSFHRKADIKLTFCAFASAPCALCFAALCQSAHSIMLHTSLLCTKLPAVHCPDAFQVPPSPPTHLHIMNNLPCSVDVLHSPSSLLPCLAPLTPRLLPSTHTC